MLLNTSNPDPDINYDNTVDSIENHISSEVNPFTNATLTAKERVFRNTMVVLLKARKRENPGPRIMGWVRQLEKYIHGQVKFNLEELDNFETRRKSRHQR